MKKRLVLLPFLAILSLTACNKTPGSNIQESSFLSSNTSGGQLDGYYSSISNDMNANELKVALQTLMFNTHTKYCTYGEIRYEFGKSDKDPNKNGNILCFYSRQSMSAQWDFGETYNREHVWPKANSGGLFKNVGNSDDGAGSDLHHVRPAKTDINTDRGSKRFGNYIPNDNVKGDCARIVMYLYVHYSSEISGSGNNRSKYVGGLNLSNVFTNISLIKQWNELDPVNDLERTRNEYCYKYQGNRNPFIDHPEFISKML